MRDVGIAYRLRRAGLTVVEIAGWQTRGSDSFNPRGSTDHHTAGGASGNAPSLAVCIYGRADLAGPLCNVLVGRDNTCYVIAAGRANHAGEGSWLGLTGNSSVYGVERENVGYATEPWRDDQTLTAALVHGALQPNADLVCEHKEWAPGRKIDCHTLQGETLRELIRFLQNPPTTPPFTPEDLMRSPIGNVDVWQPLPDGTVLVQGWAFDPDAPADQIPVHIHGFNAGHGPYVATGTTAIMREDVNAFLRANGYPAASGARGYSIIARPPQTWQDPTFIVYGIDATGDANTELARNTLHMLV